MTGIFADDVPASSIVYGYFGSFAAGTGAPSAMTGFATSDILIYKNGSTTQRSSTSGFTLLDTDGQDFDGITGINGFKIDLSDNSDAGFYAAGSHYSVVISTVTIDGQTVSFVAGGFWIEQVGGVLALVKAGVTLSTDYDFAKGTTAITESYSTDAGTITPIQLLYEINAMLQEKTASLTTLTVKKRSGATAMTFTLDSATTPSSITRAS